MITSSKDKLAAPLTKPFLSFKWYWGKWIIILMTVFWMCWAIIDVAPFLHADEFIILDLGRVILHPDTDWSIAWMMNKGQPVLVWFYLGPVFQELGFQLAGQYGARLLSLVGALAAATTVVGWLLSKDTSRNVALVLGLVFLLDPLFVQAFSLGRVDSWTMAYCIASCWALSYASRHAALGQVLKGHILLGGVLITIAFFIWPSAVFLLPLILLELAGLVRATFVFHKSWKKGVTPVLLFGVGSVFAGGFLVLPIAHQVVAQFDNIVEGVAVNTRTGPSGASSLLSHSLSQFVELFRVYKFSPILPLFGVLASIWLRRTGLLIAALTALVLMLGTLVYIQRVQYLLPYLIASVAGIYQSDFQKKHGGKSYASLIRLTGVVLPLAWCMGLSLFARTMLALDKAGERNRDIVFDAGETLIGPGEHRVFVPHEFYYTARSLGWKMYWPYLSQKERITPEIMQRILPNVDYVIAEPPSKMSRELYQVLEKEGLKPQNGYNSYEASSGGDEGKTTNIKRLRILYSIYRQPYGPYQVYVRDPLLTTAISK